MKISKNEPKTAVAKLRKAMGLTQLELANRLEISYVSVQKYEGGSRPSGEVRIKLANLAVAEGLADLALEWTDPAPFGPRIVIERPGEIRLPASSEGRHLADDLHAIVDLVVAHGRADQIVSLEETLRNLESSIAASHSTDMSSRLQGQSDMLRRRGALNKWHELLDKVRRSRYQHAIEENLTSFSNGIDAENALAELQRRVNAGEFTAIRTAGESHPGGGIEAIERETAQAESFEKEALEIAEELRRDRTPHPRRAEQHKPPKTGSGGSHGSRS